MEKILFLSCLVPRAMDKEVYEKNIGTFQSSATEFQYKILTGLDNNTKASMTICNLLPVSSYPTYYKDPVIKRQKFKFQENEITNVGFLNIRFLKRLFIARAYEREAMRLFSEGDYKKVICYSADIVLMNVLKKIKEKDSSVTTSVIIPDMPEFNDLRTDINPLLRWYMGKEARVFRKLMAFVDKYVLLTKQSADYLGIADNYLVMEGIAEVNSAPPVELCESGSKSFLYTGSTNVQFGIKNLVDAFKLIDDPDYRLIICGCGDYDSVIKAEAERDSRIIFKGIVAHDEVLSLQKSVTGLINPRQNVGEYTKYSFPSKTMEYLVTGKPVIAYKLDGIPDEYDEHIHYVKDNTVEALKNAMIEVGEMPAEMREQIGEAAKKFVLENKNETAQAKRILELIGVK